MAWIEVHQHLKEHRKTRKFKNLMGITRAQAMGHLVMLWLWGIDNTDDYGIIQDADYDDIAIACDYHDDSQLMVNSLITAGFLEKDEKDGKLFIHDFEDYIGRLKEQKKRHREAQKRYADKSKSNTNDGHADNQDDGQSDGLKIANLTVPNLTVPSPIPSKDIVSSFESIWKLYPKKEGKGAVKKTQQEKLYKIGVDEITRAVSRYVKAKSGEDKKYLQMGSTFFNSGYVDYLDKNYQEDKPKGRIGVSQAEDPGPRRDDM